MTHPHLPIANEPNLPTSRTEFVGNSVTHVPQERQACGECVGTKRFGTNDGTEGRSDWHWEVPKRARKARKRSQIDSAIKDILVRS